MFKIGDRVQIIVEKHMYTGRTGTIASCDVTPLGRLYNVVLDFGPIMWPAWKSEIAHVVTTTVIEHTLEVDICHRE